MANKVKCTKKQVSSAVRPNGLHCKCGHKKRYHSQDANSQNYVCRGAYCNCLKFEGVEL